jgi:hypothetical protein
MDAPKGGRGIDWQKPFDQPLPLLSKTPPSGPPDGGRGPRGGVPLRAILLATLAVIIVVGIGVAIWLFAGFAPKTPAPPLLTGSGSSSTAVSSPPPTGTSTTLDAFAVGSGAMQAPAYSIQISSSVTEVTLLDVWKQAAAQFAVDPDTAILERFTASWGSDTALTSFSLEARTPEGRWITLMGANTPPADPSVVERLNLDVTIKPSFTEAFTPAMVAGYPATPVSVTRLLSTLDEAGLMNIGEKSGLQVAGDPAQLWDSTMAAATSSIDMMDMSTLVCDRIDWRAYFSADMGAQEFMSYTAAPDIGETPKVVLETEGAGRLAAVAASRVPPPYVHLSRRWDLADKSTGISQSWMPGGGESYLLLPDAGGLEVAAGSTVQAVPADATLDGLAFATPDGTIDRIEKGLARKVWTPSTLSASVGAYASYGATYSARRSRLLFAGDLIWATSDASGRRVDEIVGRLASAGGQTSTDGWTYTPSGETAILAVPSAGGSLPQRIGTYRGLPGLDRVVYDENSDTMWISGYAPGFGPTTLWKVQPLGAEPKAVTLSFEFDGDFDVSPDGSAIVYLGAWKKPADVCLLTPDSDLHLSLGLAVACMPAFSPDGTKICLAGSKAVDKPTGLWVYDLASAACVELAPTEGLTPTYPVFSPDGKRVAFRNWTLGDLWTVDLESGATIRYALQTAEAAIAW